jgi:methylthioribulose-1-phosphate dehydratase
MKLPLNVSVTRGQDFTINREMCGTSKRALVMNENRGGGAKSARHDNTVHHATNGNNFAKVSSALAQIGKNFYLRGWVLGTSGNFSAVVSQEPLRLAITPKGLDKGNLKPSQFLVIDSDANITLGKGQPSSEALLHLAVVRCAHAGAVLHTHSIWSTVLSNMCLSQRGVALNGYEMLKGLEGVKSHKHREWLPILENSQDNIELVQRVSTTLHKLPEIHGFLLRKHGLYTWGASLQEAKRHVEILEFLMEVLVRSTKTLPDPVAN